MVQAFSLKTAHLLFDKTQNVYLPDYARKSHFLYPKLIEKDANLLTLYVPTWWNVQARTHPSPGIWQHTYTYIYIHITSKTPVLNMYSNFAQMHRFLPRVSVVSGWIDDRFQSHVISPACGWLIWASQFRTILVHSQTCCANARCCSHSTSKQESAYLYRNITCAHQHSGFSWNRRCSHANFCARKC